MDNFKSWIILEDFKELQKMYTKMLRDVPQDAKHHPEGDALTHTKLVRKAIPKAIKELNALKTRPVFNEILAEINFNVSDEDLKILYISAWLHDIGKSNSTTIGGVNFNFLRQFDLLYQNDPSKIRSIGHDNKQHYLPALRNLEVVSPQQTKNLYKNSSDLINFLIDHHMNFTRPEGFSNSFIKEYFLNGKALDNRRLKLLLILMWADKMGRTPETIKKSIEENEKKILMASQKSLKLQNKTNISKPKFTSIKDMIVSLHIKGLSLNQILASVKNKFPEAQDEDILQTLRSL